VPGAFRAWTQGGAEVWYRFDEKSGRYQIVRQ